MLVFVRHVGAHSDGHQHGVSKQTSINLGKFISSDTSCMKCSYDLNLGEGPCIIYLPPFICQILVFIHWTVLIFISNRVTLKTSNCSFFLFRLFWCFKSKIHVAIVVRIRAETLATQPRFSSPLFYFSYKISPGVNSLYKSYRYVPPQRVFFAPFRSEKEYKFCPFWSGVGYGFRGNYGSKNVFVISPPKRIT